jgi:alpha-ketoglutarate-dependent 2,4-dichlorophenoxyacetate dioxygenase
VIAIHPLSEGFAATVTGVTCARPLSTGDIDAIREGMDRYAVLVFPDQLLTDAQQLDFTRQFGALEAYNTPGDIRKTGDHRLGRGVADFSNLDAKGAIMSDQHRIWFFKLGDRLWHSDSSYRPVPAGWSLLSGRVIPSWGANTEFADMRAAYDALEPRDRSEVELLICEHSLLFSRAAIGFTEFSADEVELFRPVRHPLVRRHPTSGRRSLFLSAHAGAIVGWTIPEARMFLRDLVEHATRREFVYSHAWRPNDLVIWDNRATMHRARRFDRTEIRDVRRTTLAGEPALAVGA